jgi:hypothetical protein
MTIRSQSAGSFFCQHFGCAAFMGRYPPSRENLSRVSNFIREIRLMARLPFAQARAEPTQLRRALRRTLRRHVRVTFTPLQTGFLCKTCARMGSRLEAPMESGFGSSKPCIYADLAAMREP